MATTTNYSWTTPDDTDLVKDGAAAIRTLGSSIDTTTKNLNPETTTGAIAYRSATANVNTALPIGTNGQILTVAAGVPSWAAPAAGGANWSLLNSGGTTLTGAATITVSGISGKDKILILVQDASINNTNADQVRSRFNTDTGSNYYVYGWLLAMSTSYSVQSMETYDGAKTGVDMAGQGYSNSSIASGYLLMSGANAAGVKAFHFSGGAQDTQQIPRTFNGGGYYNSASTISSVSLTTSGGDFDGGTIFVYTSA
jgi:hypothetical protein